MIPMPNMQKIIYILISFIGVMLTYPSDAITIEPSNKILQQQKTMLTQAWQLSENYDKGLTVESNPVKALAWQFVYVMTLPHAYPGLDTLLEPYKAKLTKAQIEEALDYSKWLIRNYQFPSKMDENQLIKVFEAKEDPNELAKANEKAYPTFAHFLEAVKVNDDLLAKRYKNQWQTLREEKKADEQLVFGRLQINGPALEQSVIKDQDIHVDTYGFFIGKIKVPLVFNAKGCQAFIGPAIDLTKPIQNLGLIVLNPAPEAALGSIVGSISPATDIDKVGLGLLFKDQYLDKEEPWYTPTMAVTKLDNGQFYVKDLAPGVYELIVSLRGQKQSLMVNVGSGQVKTIKPITF